MSDESLRAALARMTVDLDGNDWEHNPGCEGEPECPACWAGGIRDALAAHPAESRSAKPNAQSPTATSVPVADRERVAEVATLALHGGEDCTWSDPTDCPLGEQGIEVADALSAAGVFFQPEVSEPQVSEPPATPEAEGVRPEAVALDRDALSRALVEFGADIRLLQGTPAELLGKAVDAVMKLARPEAVVKAEALREAAASLPLQGLVGETARIILRERADELEAGR